MTTHSEDNKRIAKNTMLLYFRMILTMLVSLYTSRVVLQILGVEDFGIYNVVGGIVLMLGFLNGALSSSTSRYITFALGKGDFQNLNHVFCVSNNIHAILSFVVIILAETVGLWYFNTKIVMPPERFQAAFWVYQCSIVTIVVSIMAVPYNALIIAHEKMSAFAYISIVEVLLKLGIVFLLNVFPFDKLIVYAVLLVLVQACIRSCYIFYCKMHFQESRYNFNWDITLTKEMATFSIYSVWGNLAVATYTIGINLLLNVFFGPIVNAARAISVQVQNAVQQFISNFQTALNPQIIKSYAVGDINYTFKLMYRSARFSFFLMLIFALPIMIEADYILNLWLTEVPENTVTFLRLILLTSLTYTLANPLIILAQATGKIKKYQLIAGGVLLFVLPISYVCLKFGLPAYSVFVVHFCIESVDLYVRMFLLRSMANLSMREFIKKVNIPVVIVVAISVVLPLLVYYSMSVGMIRFLVVCVVSILSTSITILYVGLTPNERKFIFEKIRIFSNKIK